MQKTIVKSENLGDKSCYCFRVLWFGPPLPSLAQVLESVRRDRVLPAPQIRNGECVPRILVESFEEKYRMVKVTDPEEERK